MIGFRRGAAVFALILSTALRVFAQTEVQVGYSVVTPESVAAASGSALFSYRNSDGVLVSEAGVGSAQLTTSGRIFVDESAETRTGIAIVNRSADLASVTMTLRDAAGAEIVQGVLQLTAGQHLSRFVDELFPDRPRPFTGTMTFESSRPLASVTLRLTQSVYGESLFTTLPVVNLAGQASGGVLVFPHIAVGGGYATQLVLVNPGSRALRGRVNLTGSDGLPLLVRQQGTTLAGFTYEIAPHGSYRTELDASSDLKVGYASVEPEPGGTPPAGSAIFRFAPGGRLLTEAGVGAIPPTIAARIFVDYIDTVTGFAIANPGDVAARLTLTLADRNGVTIETNSSVTLPPRNHLARLVDELFPSIANGFSGVLEIRSSTPIVPITLKQTTNTRNDLVLTTLPVADATLPPSDASLVFPQIALGGGYTTRLILLNAGTTDGSVSVSFFKSDGTSLVVPMSGTTGAQFQYRMVSGGARRLLPGNSAVPATISLVDPASNQSTNEIVVNERNTVPLRLLVRDNTTAPRDDFDVSVVSLDPAIATVNGLTGGIEGKKAGFSTLTILAGSALRTVTANVVRVDSGEPGFEVAGIAQDTARRIYLASTQTYAIFRAENLSQTAQLYAGIPGSAGLRNDERLQSQFRSPAFLALNHADGSLYVSDSGNDAIRRVGAGAGGKVTTLAGEFSNPQGIALDGRGNLWVADSGSHTIRRINLVSGVVETIAGLAGVPGFADGRAGQARFQSPGGIAIETETIAQELERLRKGEPAPALSVLVADTGNGLIRRVRETGEVETVLGAQAANSRAATVPGDFVSFLSPAGVAVDAAGNIYVTEPDAGRVRVLLRTGEVVPAAQAGTFEAPRGIAVTQSGKALVAARDRAARELVYGEPRIASVAPAAIRKGVKVTLKGTNFAPDSIVVIAGFVIPDRIIADTQTITFTTPDIPTGLSTLTVENRGGLAQASVLVDAVPLNELPVGYITTVAGGSTYGGEGGNALSAPLNPAGMAVDANGNVFVADYENRKIRRIESRTGTITTVAGTGSPNTPLVDGGPAIAAGLYGPAGVLFDLSGNLLIADGFRIRKVDARTGFISTVVGAGSEFAYITGFAIDAEGNLYVGDYYGNHVTRVDGRTNTITTIAGNGGAGYSGEDVDARDATLSGTYGLAIDNARNVLYIAGNERVRKVDLASNRITTVVGGGTRYGGSSDGLSALEAAMVPIGLAVDASGNLFIADSSQRVRKFDPVTGILTTAAGGGSPPDGIGDGGSALAATFDRAWSVALDGGGNLFIGDSANNGIHYFVRKVDATTQSISTIAGTGQRAPVDDGGAATAATIAGPFGVSFDSDSNLYITDSGHNRIRKVDALTKIITTVAGGGTTIEPGGPATDFYFYSVDGRVAIDDAGNLYIAESVVARIRKVDAVTNRISTVAENVRATDLALDRRGNLYIADSESRRVWKLDLSTGVMTTLAGGGQPVSGIGDGGFATNAVLGTEIRIASDASGYVFIADWDNERVRLVDPTNGIITSVATGVKPVAVGLDAAGNLLIVDWTWPEQIQSVSLSTGAMRIVAGAGPVELPNLGDNGPAVGANLYYPYAVASDPSGNIFIADTSNNRIRAVRGPVP